MKIDWKKTIIATLCTGLLVTGAACAKSGALSPDPAPPTSSESPAEPVLPPDEPFEEESESTPTPEPVRYIKIKTDGLNVRAKATTSATVLGSVDSDVNMLYLGAENGFYKTYYKGNVAYVSAKTAYSETFTLPPADDERIEKVIFEGCKRIGVPYVYGAVRLHDGKGNFHKGFTAAKFDCSSLTQYIFYYGADILLDVNTRTQIYQGKSVARKDLTRGDVIFFTNSSRYNKTGIERVGHVALYLGDNLILHTASDYCKIEEISSKRWSYYIETKRMI